MRNAYEFFSVIQKKSFWESIGSVQLNRHSEYYKIIFTKVSQQFTRIRIIGNDIYCNTQKMQNRTKLDGQLKSQRQDEHPAATLNMLHSSDTV